MKKLNLFFGLLIVAASFQACHSPEARGAKDDSLAKDSTKTDSTASKTDTTAGKTDTTKTMGTKPDSTASPKK
ncbi:hypothetical protein [Pedobacter sp. L105]|uniref:hypothetical protein n=1 Tax=Pedobacter sp. L105 TaxID=1641871 RepID=UPI00131CFD58|nr:hypothetical protein [Pedobacter sp. L105]